MKKFKILFISSNQELLSFANLFLMNSDAFIEISTAESVTKAIDVLSHHKFDLIYLGHQIQLDEKLALLSKELVSIINSNKTLFYGTNKAFKDKDWAIYFHEWTPAAKILFSIYQKLGLGEQNQEYIKIALLNLMNFSHYPFDCFFKVKKEGHDNYIKIYNLNEEILFDDIDKYRMKNVEDLYILKKDILDELAKAKNSIQEPLHEFTPNEISENALEYVGAVLDELGLNITTQHKIITKQAFEHTREIIENSKTDKQILLDLINKSDIFYYKHITMTSLVSCVVLDKMMLSDASFKEKLCLASNLQNIFLNKDKEIMVSKKDQLAHFDAASQIRILDHAQMAAQLLEKNNKIDSDVIKIIREHHGDKNGKGFPEKISSTSKLSLVFQLSSEFSLQYLIAQTQNIDLDIIKILNIIIDTMETRDKSLIKALREVALKFI